MSLSAVSQTSGIWSHATSALASTPTAPGTAPRAGVRPNEAGSVAPPAPAASPANPFQALSSDVQQVLLRMQAG